MLDRRPRLAVQTKGNPISTSAATLLDQWLQVRLKLIWWLGSFF
jgi:hypothetical protein